MKILFKCKFGSHLYGTATDKSDTDYKGIFLPSVEDLILQRASDHVSMNTKSDTTKKNTSEDIDCEFYSLHYFLKLAAKGETAAIDMLHCNKENTVITSPEWEFIQANRSKFYTKNIKAFVGYSRGQASKYGCKGSRLSACKQVLDLLEDMIDFNESKHLSSVWNLLPEGEHLKKGIYEECTSQADKRVYTVCSKKLMATTPISKCIETLQAFYDNYGARAKQAALDQGIDYKAISHAFRAVYEIKEILETGDLKFPLKEADFLRKVKNHELKYKDGLGEVLDTLIEQIEILVLNSSFPEKIDMNFWNNWLTDKVYGHIKYKNDSTF